MIKSLTEEYGLELLKSRNEGVEVYGHHTNSFVLVARTVADPIDDFLFSAEKSFGWKP
jgi:hypothetical protein